MLRFSASTEEPANDKSGFNTLDVKVQRRKNAGFKEHVLFIKHLFYN